MTRLGVLGGRCAASIDAFGSVQLHGERFSWWVGAGDAWHRPAEEVAVRQSLRRGAPVVDTAWRVAGGDLRTESYGAMVGGREWIVVEVHNDSRVPVTLALVLERTAGGPAPWTLEGTALRRAGAAAPLLVSGRPADACCDADDADALLERLRAGDTTLFDPATGAAGVRAAGAGRCAAVVFALTHAGSLRVLLSPVGPSAHAAEPAPPAGAAPTPADVARAPGGDAVVRGWLQQLGAVGRFDLGDDAAEADATRRRAQLLLGAAVAPQPAGAGVGVDAVLDASALAWFGHPVEALARLDAVLGSLRPALDAAVAQRVLVAMADVVRCSPEAPALAPLLLPGALDLAAWASSARGEDPVARWALHELAVRAGTPPADGAVAPGGAPAAVRRAAPKHTEGYGLLVQRAVLLDDDEPGVVDLLPGWRAAWRGRPVDVHGLPTAAGTLSFAIRWHGSRPALLWQLDRTPGAPAEVVLRAPALDPGFSSARPSGEALLAEPVSSPG